MSAASHRIAASVVALFAAVFACSEDPNSAAPAAEPVLLAPGGFQLAPRDEAIGRERFDSATGSLERLGLPLRVQIARAWGLRPRDLHLQIELPKGAFDVRARPLDGTREGAEALIRGGLSEHFGLVVERGNWKGPVAALRLVPGGLVPQPTEARGVEAGEGEDVRRVGKYHVSGAPISDLVDFLGQSSPIPVLDATGLDGHYDLSIEWDASQGGRALRSALLDAGFELVNDRGELERWVARPAR